MSASTFLEIQNVLAMFIMLDPFLFGITAFFVHSMVTGHFSYSRNNICFYNVLYMLMLSDKYFFCISTITFYFVIILYLFFHKRLIILFYFEKSDNH